MKELRCRALRDGFESVPRSGTPQLARGAPSFLHFFIPSFLHAESSIAIRAAS
jgi:hypothetical protein